MIGKIAGDVQVSRVLSAASTNATVIKTAAGQVHGWYLYNGNAAARFVRLYDVTGGAVVVGTTPPKLTIPIPPGAAANVWLDDGIAFALGIGLSTTTAFADNDTGAVAAGDIICNVFYR